MITNKRDWAAEGRAEALEMFNEDRDEARRALIAWTAILEGNPKHIDREKIQGAIDEWNRLFDAEKNGQAS